MGAAGLGCRLRRLLFFLPFGFGFFWVFWVFFCSVSCQEQGPAEAVMGSTWRGEARRGGAEVRPARVRGAAAGAVGPSGTCCSQSGRGARREASTREVGAAARRRGAEGRKAVRAPAGSNARHSITGSAYAAFRYAPACCCTTLLLLQLCAVVRKVAFVQSYQRKQSR